MIQSFIEEKTKTDVQKFNKLKKYLSYLNLIVY